jgi:hypothetical protein
LRGSPRDEDPFPGSFETTVVSPLGVHVEELTTIRTSAIHRNLIVVSV